VQREFYYNDAGEQIARLARSVWARYQQHFGRDVPFPEDGYHGSYVTELAAQFAEREGEVYVGEETPEALDAMRRFAVAELRAEQNADLDAFRVHFDHFFLESSLYESGRVEETITRLKETGLAYEKDGALWLRTTDFGDDKDRVMVKSTGHPTYFLPDVAYHVTKWERGFHRAINVQGSDHHGTVARVRAGLRALGLPEGYPEYALHQMVTVMRGGEEVKFSKRAGDYVTLRDLVDEVGADVTRYFFLMRRSEAQLTFDLDLALDQSEKNPVYKLQYAHARMSSIFRRAGVEVGDIDAEAADLSLLDQPAEHEIIKVLLRFPEVVAAAAERHAPHSICEYLEEVGAAVNSWYHAGNLNPGLRVVGAEVPESVGRARLVLARAIQIVLANGLALLGVSAPDRMDRADESA
jgi:arginyl-tRNA synthetase